MNRFGPAKYSRSESGQALLLLLACIVVLIAFVGFGTDLGLAYITKAKLAKAADAACLTAMRYLGKGETNAQDLAKSAFHTNYVQSSLDNVSPTVDVSFATDANNNTSASATAKATINTYFTRVIGQKTLNVTATAQSTRANVIMSLVLDRSGSMNNNGGAQALPAAVTDFVNYFDNSLDHVSMISFATSSKVDVPLSTGFQSPIASKVSSFASTGAFTGGTFSQAGMLDAQTQNNSLAIIPGENVVKVIVFFTDGWANMIQDTLNCTPNAPSSTLVNVNYGGCAPPEDKQSVGFRGCGVGISYCNPKTPEGTPCNLVTCNASSFPATDGLSNSLVPVGTRTPELNVSNEAMYRVIQVANAVRAEPTPTVVYAIGLGDKINETFLHQVANDSASPTYDPSKPVGLALFAQNCPSPTCTAELQEVFQTIASKILLRLTE